MTMQIKKTSSQNSTQISPEWRPFGPGVCFQLSINTLHSKHLELPVIQILITADVEFVENVIDGIAVKVEQESEVGELLCRYGTGVVLVKKAEHCLRVTVDELW